MKVNHKIIAAIAIMGTLLIGSRTVSKIQTVHAEYTPDEQHLTGVEANNLDSKKVKVATKADYQKLLAWSKQPGAHYLDEPVAIYLFPENNDSMTKAEIYYYSDDDDSGKFLKNERNDEYDTKNYLVFEPHRIIGTMNIDGQGYFIEHTLKTDVQSLISNEYFNFPYAGYKLRKHKKVLIYTKNGKQTKKHLARRKSGYVASKDPILMNGKKFQRLYYYTIYGTTSYLHVVYIKNCDLKKLIPGKASLDWGGTWNKVKGKNLYTKHKREAKFIKHHDDHWHDFADSDYIDPEKEDKLFIEGINADYRREDFDWSKYYDDDDE